ncbi:MAG: NAD(P)H-quinone oxidoreductase [Bacteroidota bacterium]
MMKAVLISEFGGPEVMHIGERPKPDCGPEELLVKVKATAINRADTMQRAGKYPPPPGATDIMGLEMAGEIVETGTKVSGWQKGEGVCALLSGGGYAEYVSIPAATAMKIPEGWDYIKAAAMPEVYLTAFQALDWIGDLQAGEKILIHAGASGVGTAATQIALLKGAEVIVTASAGKHALCLELGANKAIDYKSEDFAAVIAEYTNGTGVNFILDFIAAPYFQSNLNSLALDGRLVMLSLMGGVKVDGINLAPILRKRLSILGSTLRSRSLDYKISLTRAFCQFAEPFWQKGELQPVIDSIFPWTEVKEAHQHMGANQNKGKIVMKMD